MSELYAIVFKSDKKLVTPSELKKRWPKYGTNGLYGWRPPKRVYDTLGKAKAGFAHLPEDLKPELCIHPFGPVGSPIDGVKLAAEQIDRREKRLEARERSYQRWKKQFTNR